MAMLTTDTTFSGLWRHHFEPREIERVPRLPHPNPTVRFSPMPCRGKEELARDRKTRTGNARLCLAARWTI
jgi:hypothetical protein